MTSADLTLFAHVLGRPEGELDLAQAALLVAEADQPGLDVAHYMAVLDRLGWEARRWLAEPRPAGARPVAPIARVVGLLYGELGFHGNAGDYYDPRNSFLNLVLERRTGIPISLAIVLVEVCRRASVDAAGVSFPGHFLVRSAGPNGPVLVDPFEGRLLDRDGLRALHARATGAARDPEPSLLEPAPKLQIVLRMLNNLRGIYASRGDRDRLRGVLERIAVLAPSEELRRQIAQLGGGEPPRIARRGPSSTGGPVLN